MAGREHQGRQIRIGIRTTPDRVWEAWTEPEKLSRLAAGLGNGGGA